VPQRHAPALPSAQEKYPLYVYQLTNDNGLNNDTIRIFWQKIFACHASALGQLVVFMTKTIALYFKNYHRLKELGSTNLLRLVRKEHKLCFCSIKYEQIYKI
jgi:hypothetical protein